MRKIRHFFGFIRSVSKFCKKLSVKFQKDAVAAYAAQAAFFIVLSFLPFVIFLLSLLNYVPATETEMLEMIERLIPTALHSFVHAALSSVLGKQSAAILSIAVIAALWAASKGFMAIIRGLNSVYGEPDVRNYFLVRLISAFYTILLSVMLLLTLLLLGFGNQILALILRYLPFLSKAAFIVYGARFFGMLGFLFLFFLGVNRLIPKTKLKFRFLFPGALISAGGWLGFSFLYSFYIDNLSEFSAMYGSLTAIILCMVWLYSCMYIMFFGAEMNSVLADKELRSELTGILVMAFRRKKTKDEKTKDANAENEPLKEKCGNGKKKGRK